MKRYPVPAQEIRREVIVVNSRFIATLAPMFSVEQGENFSGEVILTARFPVERMPGFQEALRDLSSRSVQVVLIETGEILMPLPR